MDYKYLKLEEKVKKLWCAIGIIIFLLLEAGIWSLTFLVFYGNIISIFTSGVLTLLLGAFIFIYLKLAYKNYFYYYDEERIIIKKGVLFKHHIVIPVCQIQDLHIYEGPLMQIAKLDGIIISTAGSNFIIKGMSKENSAKMISELENNLHKRLEVLNNEELH